MELLPRELVSCILEKLKPQYLIITKLVSREWYQLSRYLWLKYNSIILRQYYHLQIKIDKQKLINYYWARGNDYVIQLIDYYHSYPTCFSCYYVKKNNSFNIIEHLDMYPNLQKKILYDPNYQFCKNECALYAANFLDAIYKKQKPEYCFELSWLMREFAYKVGAYFVFDQINYFYNFDPKCNWMDYMVLACKNYKFLTCETKKHLMSVINYSEKQFDYAFTSSCWTFLDDKFLEKLFKVAFVDLSYIPKHIILCLFKHARIRLIKFLGINITIDMIDSNAGIKYQVDDDELIEYAQFINSKLENNNNIRTLLLYNVYLSRPHLLKKIFNALNCAAPPLWESLIMKNAKYAHKLCVMTKSNPPFGFSVKLYIGELYVLQKFYPREKIIEIISKRKFLSLMMKESNYIMYVVDLLKIVISNNAFNHLKNNLLYYHIPSYQAMDIVEKKSRINMIGA